MRGFLSKKEILQNKVEINEYKDVQTNETGCSAVKHPALKNFIAYWNGRRSSSLATIWVSLPLPFSCPLQLSNQPLPLSSSPLFEVLGACLEADNDRANGERIAPISSSLRRTLNKTTKVPAHKYLYLYFKHVDVRILVQSIESQGYL